MQEMAALSPLDESLQGSFLATNTKHTILNQLWGLNQSRALLHRNSSQYDPYFAYYKEQCGLALHDGGRHLSARTHRDIDNIIQYFKEPLTRSDIKKKLREKLTRPRPENEDEILDGSIDLGARVWLMMDFGDLSYAFSGRKQLEWIDGPLQDFLKRYFSVDRVLSSEGVKLQKLFNVRNLTRIAGIEVSWTTNLADHLRVIDEDKKVAIFHHVSFLELHKKSSIFPDGFIDETLRTLALLCPQTDDDIKKWIQKVPPAQLLDKKVRECGHLRADDRRIESFKFWHDRLVILKQVFDEAEPSNLSQWWYDRRKGTQWYTFWIAALVLVLTIFFGAVQCVEGALQVYKAFVPTR